VQLVLWLKIPITFCLTVQWPDIFGALILYPRSCEEFVDIFLSCGGAKPNKLMMFWFATVSWVLWITRNERVFQHKVLANPVYPLYRALSLMLQWRVLAKPKAQQSTDVVIKKFDEKLKLLAAAPGGRVGVG
jgi:hypothetical protein